MATRQVGLWAAALHLAMTPGDGILAAERHMRLVCRRIRDEQVFEEGKVQSDSSPCLPLVTEVTFG
jgi:hypothetical protein